MSCPDSLSVADASARLIEAIRQAEHLRPAGAGVDAEIVIPIYNAFPETVACIESVCRRTDSPFRLLLINDGSVDPRVSDLLHSLDGTSSGMRVVDRAENRGFVATVNEGFALSAPNPAVILNSDTVVSTGWLRRMVAAARSRPRVATVTPLTNSGTICSVPEPWIFNTLPEGYDVQTFGELIATLSLRIRPEVPTGVGFCMWVSREALDEVGPFDEQAFGRGYGEENDFCQHAIRAGFINLIADDAFVYHVDHASFGGEWSWRAAENLARVEARNPTYLAEIHALVADHPLALFHDYLTRAIAGGPAAPPCIRVLHVLHSIGGGSDKHVADLASTTDARVQSFVLRCDGHALAIDEFWRGRQLRTLTFPLRVPLKTAWTRSSDAYSEAFDAACWALKINIVHVHQILWNTFDIADVAGRRGIPYLYTGHDYYMVCPQYTLTDPAGNRCCGGEEGASPDRVRSCLKSLGLSPEDLAEHRQRAERFLAGAAQVLFPARRPLDIVGACYPAIAGAAAVVPHGLDAHLEEQAESRADAHGCVSGSVPDDADVGVDDGEDLVARPDAVEERPTPTAAPQRAAIPPLNVALVGRINRNKGLDVFRAVLKANRRDELVFHLFGITSDDRMNELPLNTPTRVDGSWVVNHGPYRERDIIGLIRCHDIHVGLQPAIWEETFSYTLSEFALAAIPVVAGDFGAPGERITRHSLGWTVADIDDPSEILAILYGILDNPRLLADKVAEMDIQGAVRPIADMQRDHVSYYEKNAGPGDDRGLPPVPDSPEYVAFLAMQVRRGTLQMPTREYIRQFLKQMMPGRGASESRVPGWVRRGAKGLFRSVPPEIRDRIFRVSLPLLWPMASRVVSAAWDAYQQRRDAPDQPKRS
ncbi:MAG: glycosyltransferase [Vicinamibacterales bacterium]